MNTVKLNYRTQSNEAPSRPRAEPHLRRADMHVTTLSKNLISVHGTPVGVGWFGTGRWQRLGSKWEATQSPPSGIMRGANKSRSLADLRNETPRDTPRIFMPNMNNEINGSINSGSSFSCDPRQLDSVPREGSIFISRWALEAMHSRAAQGSC